MAKWAVWLGALALAGAARGAVSLYPAPRGLTPDPAYQVTVDGQPCFVYRLSAAAVCRFGFNGARYRAEVVVRSAKAAQSVTVRPLRAGYHPRLEDRSVRFELTSARRLSIEFDTGRDHPLLLIADGPEAAPPKPGPGGVRYFHGGETYDVGRLELRSGEMLYVGPGAVLYGQIVADQVKDARILGRGMVLGSFAKKDGGPLVDIRRSPGVSVGELLLGDGPGAGLRAAASDHLRSDGLIVVNGSSERGVDLIGCRDAWLSRTFVRSGGDAVVVRSGVEDLGFSTQRDVRDVVVHGLVVATAGAAMRIGPETRTEELRRVRFNDVDVIRADGAEPVLSIQAGDRATIGAVEFADVRVEDAPASLLELRVAEQPASRDRERGHIEYIRLKNVKAAGGQAGYVGGPDVRHAVEMVRFENVVQGAVKWQSEQTSGLKLGTATGLVFR